MENQTIDTNRIYNAFKEAGLEREARQLSTTVKGKVVPAIGHYIAIVDNIGAWRCQETKTRSFPVFSSAVLIHPNKYQLLTESMLQIKNYVLNLCFDEKNSDKLGKLERLDSELNRFLNYK